MTLQPVESPGLSILLHPTQNAWRNVKRRLMHSWLTEIQMKYNGTWISLFPQSLVLQQYLMSALYRTDIPHLKYLSMCVKEGLRMHAPVPYIQRITTKDCYIDGFLIPKDTNISIVLHTILHHPDVWEKPMVRRVTEHLEWFFMMDNDPWMLESISSHFFIPLSRNSFQRDSHLRKLIQWAVTPLFPSLQVPGEHMP